MISTRTHGLIDYGVVALFGMLAARDGLPRPARWLLGSASVFHAGTSVLTDYEAGFYPKIGMRTHLALDTIGALTLGAASWLMRRQPGWVRAMLVGAALAELTVVVLSNPDPGSGPGQGFGPVDRALGQPTRPERIGYPPLDLPKRVVDDVFIVDSVMSGLLGAMLPVRMTVIRLPDGSVLLHSPTRFTFKLKEALEEIGPIRHLVAPSFAHWMFLRDWQRACPGATTWAAPGLRSRRQVRRSGLRLDWDLTEGSPVVWGGALTLVTVPGGFKFREAGFFHRASGTLILTDLVLNLEPPKVPAPFRPVMRLFGSLAPDGMPPPYLRAVIRIRRRTAADAVRRLLALRPERVIFAHGRWFENDGAAKLRHAMRWLLGP